MTRKCPEYGSERLEMVAYADGLPADGPLWRKECLDYGSCGPFIPLDADATATPHMRSLEQLEASVARFCDEEVA